MTVALSISLVVTDAKSVFLTVFKYNREICIASIVVPDLNDKELQDSYGTMGASELFGTMFNWGESALILEAVTELSGINQTFQDKVDEAKN